ncbi:LPS export ABC transporter permease LptG [Pelistega europaea]|uniref:LPS export ABC transporter permease LptG n=1 Tax=Pelistega europaea TaxID=106147 RepID=A0A7Y4LAD7_9BURK|nr:LPS export ABC transporter permease LptG [Pelistega europaea]NOL49960.1 LPS export ABC transporter permease LptG [Pelistega europaea]
MRTARHYIANEIYRTTAVVIVVLLGLFTFFETIDALDKISEKFSFLTLLYMQVLQFPTRLYDLLPISLLIGTVIALAGLAQRNELTILRVSGVSGRRLLMTLWIITIPIMLFATFLSEIATPYAESKSSELTLTALGKNSTDMDSGYWFREPVNQDEYRVINILHLDSRSEVSGITLFEYDVKNNQLSRVISAPKGEIQHGEITLHDVTERKSLLNINTVLTQADTSLETISVLNKYPTLSLKTSVTNDRLVATELQPDRMSTANLLNYIQYLKQNHLQTNRHVVALWRKGSYPFTLLVMITLAAPIGFVQSRKGGVGSKIFLGILIGIVFFMANQLALNVGMLNNLPPWLTALLPNMVALILAFMALYLMERQRKPESFIHAK